ncbi:M14 family zinc carboxypeptidase [Actinophytocola xanthii]|uniref:Peptidase M14 n=1 Tax=Actinophytocola xanthii TaxID=1912961 RepID=A0A1Q8CXC3_9PSEU|nr:M14 family zinc carboxypeptidase [Actinophytocola xanthii]OLF19007.1 peptidase M14 [Actinophytocola xanthii]
MRIRPRSLLTLATATALALTVLTAPAQAAPAPPAAGRLWHEVDPRPTNEEVARELRRIAHQARGRVDVRSIGATNEGRPVWAARVGHGPVRIQYITQQHGDEPLGTPAAIEFLRTVGVGNTLWHKWLRSRVTVDLVVRANPDGHVRDWRYNYDPTADPEYGERGKGYDINRYHDPAVAPEDNPATEAGHIQRAYAGFRPHITMDYHMQGRYVDEDGREITASLLWPTHPGVAPAAVNAAKQVAVVAQRTIDLVGGNVSQYPGGDYEGIARNAYGLRGSASVLLELSATGPEFEQAQIRSAYAAMLAVAQTAADGSLRRVDPARADAIPPRGEPVGTEIAADRAD